MEFIVKVIGNISDFFERSGTFFMDINVKLVLLNFFDIRVSFNVKSINICIDGMVVYPWDQFSHYMLDGAFIFALELFSGVPKLSFEF